MGQPLLGTELSSELLQKWQSTTRACLEMAFGPGDQNVHDVVRAGSMVTRVFRTGDPAGERYRLNQRNEALKRQLVALEGSIDTLRIRADVLPPVADVEDASAGPEASELDMFVSHSHRDSELANKLITLLVAALRLRRNRIRCTSVDGHKLDGGAHVSTQLVDDIRDCGVLLGLLSSDSLDSFYVATELGGRRLMGRPLIPLRAAGVTPDMVKAPISELHSLDITRRAELHQLITQVGRILGIQPEPPESYQRQIDELVALAAQQATPALGGAVFKTARPGLSPEQQRVLVLFANKEDQRVPHLRAEHVARDLSWPQSEAQHHIDLLLAAELLQALYFEDAYSLSAAGRAAAIAARRAGTEG